MCIVVFKVLKTIDINTKHVKLIYKYEPKIW